MRKFFALALVAVMMLALVACGDGKIPANTGDSVATDNTTASTDATTDATPVADDSFKIGFIFLHDENSTYDLNFINAAREAQAALGLSDDQVIFKTNIPESNECYEAALDLVDRGCTVIFADSFGHESYMLQAARENPDVQFCHATGTMAHTEGLANFHNAFASIYEGRYLAGIAAAMEVQFTGSWYDETAEKEAATTLISRGCKLISQHADSMGAPTACETAGVPNVSYNGSTVAACPNTFIVSSRINWAPYFEYIVNCAKSGEAIAADWTGTLATGSVELSEINAKAAAEGTQAAIDAAVAKLESGELHVFDTAVFTVGGETITSYLADVDTDANYEKDTEVVADGYFHESEKRSAPYFDLDIDGITKLNAAY